MIERRVLSLLLGLAGASAPATCAWAATGDACVDAVHEAVRLQAAQRLSAARARLSVCAAGECSAAAHKECADRVAALDAAMPAFVLIVRDGQGRDLPDARVSMDGAPLVERIDGRAVSVDPGEHHLRFQAEGFNQIETTVAAHEGQRKLRVLVFLTPARTGAALALREPSLELPGPGPAPGWSSGNAQPQAATPRWRKKVGGALLGAAAGSLVVGTVWAFLAKAEYDHALTTECGGRPDACSPQGIADGGAAHDRAFVATIAFVGAGALLAGAATVYFAWPTTKQDRITLAPTLSGNGAGVALNW